MPRDDFSKDVIDKLRSRVGNRCSNQECRVPTTAASEEDINKVNNIGVAAHICAASPGGPRYLARMTPGERKSIDNGIWLCANCAANIDRDVESHTVSLLRKWKREAEKSAREELGKKLPAKQDAIDAVSAALTGLPTGFIPNAISNVHAASRNVLEGLDDRFRVKSSFTDQGTKFEIYAKENVDVFMHVTDDYRKEFQDKHKRLVEHGEDLEICAGAIKFDGSRLIEEIANICGHGKIVLSPRRTAGIQKLWVVNSETSAAETLDDIKGDVTLGSESLSFKGSCFNEMFTFGYRKLNHEHDGQFNVAIDFSSWEKRDIRSLPYFRKLYSLFDRLANGWELRTSLEVNGTKVLGAKSLIKGDFVELTALSLRYIDRAATLLRYLDCAVKYVGDFSFTPEELRFLSEAARICEGKCVYTRNEIDSNPSCDLTVSDEAANIRLLKSHLGTPIDITVSMFEGDRVSLFGQTVRLPRKQYLLRSVIPELTSSPTDVREGDVVHVVWLPAEGFECRVEFTDS